MEADTPDFSLEEMSGGREAEQKKKNKQLIKCVKTFTIMALPVYVT